MLAMFSKINNFLFRKIYWCTLGDKTGRTVSWY